jgi:Rps23 Pro-64 3,4-dihydroxylase Tpa1-like proline 4-hydroxylase
MFDYSEKYIHRVPNFMNKEDAELVLAYIESWKLDENLVQKEVRFIEDIEDEKIKKIIEESEKNTYLEIIGNYAKNLNLRIEKLTWMRRLELVKWKYSQGLDPHRDGHKVIPDEPEFSLSTLIYLNDEYSGGEISFPEYDLSIKPKAGELVIFPSYFLHEVKQVHEISNGRSRCTMPMFYTFEARKFGEYTHFSYLEQIEQHNNGKGEYFFTQTRKEE